MNELDQAPWRAPSVPLTLATGGEWEIRTAVVPATDIAVTYQHWHESGRVDLLLVERAPEG